MKFARFELCMQYMLTTAQRGCRIKHLTNAEVHPVELLFSALESSFIYLPLDQRELIGAALAEFSRHGIPIPDEFSKSPIQYFVNSQLQYSLGRAVGRQWDVQRNASYGRRSNHTADLRVAVTADENADLPYEPFNIWVESDPVRDVRSLQKSWYKAVIASNSGSCGHDIFVQFLYGTSKFHRIRTIAEGLGRTFDAGCRSLTPKMSFVIAHTTPSDLSAHVVVESDLILFEGAALRIDECYFHGWTRDGDFWLLNERVKKKRMTDFHLARSEVECSEDAASERTPTDEPESSPR